MKKKILSMFMSLCVCVCTLFSLVGCSVVSVDTTKQNKKEVMRVGNTNMTKSDIINSFYTYYQNNNSYFANYDQKTIEDSFYTWSTIKQIVKEKSAIALYDAETNPNGYIIYSEKDDKDVMDSALEYIYSQVSSYEIAIYELNKVEEDDYPKWIKEAEDEEETSGFEIYESAKPEVEIKTKNDAVKKQTDEQVKEKLDDLKKYLFEYVSVEAEDEDGEDERANIDETVSSKYIVGARNSAYAKYIENLDSNEKAAGTDLTHMSKSEKENYLLGKEFVRVYNAYYDSQISSLFQSYWMENYLMNEGAVDINGDGVVDYDKDSLSDKAVVEAYLKQYFTDVQLYQVEDSYVANMTSSDGASLILYNYKGQNYFFSVQHILVKYDDYMTTEITKIPGYGASSTDYVESIVKEYKKRREDLTKAYDKVMLTKVNEEVAEKFSSIDYKSYGEYYFFDEDYKGDSEHNYGYIKVLAEEQTDESIVYKRTDTNEVVDKEDVKFMATKDQILASYDANLDSWFDLIDEYLDANETERAELEKEHEDIAYVYETVLNMEKYALSEEEIHNKVASYLFVELQWIYSSDSLGNELSNKIGYIVSNYEDENGSWVVDFAVGARNILKNLPEYVSGVIDTSVVDQTNVVLSDFGYHIIKIDNIYKGGSSLVDMSKLTKDININDAAFVKEMADLLRQTYVCSASNQTMYDYFYDSIYEELVGSSESSGSYFMALQYKWLAEYHAEGKIEYFNKMTYDELMDSINK